MSRTKKYVAGLYCRLSKDDGNSVESMSIWSQKVMLKQYAESNSIAIYDYYVDDGYSGTNFERPSFKKMITDIENGKINCVITKDLSRLGRNYLQSGAYIEMYFPQKNIRYIAITDGIDTLNSNQNDIMPFKNILNEMYAKDTSKKVKSAIQSRMREGTYIGSKAPFGYLKDPNNKRRLIIDEKTKPIIELIYKLCLEGKGTQLISQELMKRKIPRPSAFVENAEKLYGLTEENKYQWSHRMVLNVLRDPVYCGNMARNKRPTLSFKNSKRMYIPKSDYIYAKDTHEGIVSEEIWKQVQTMIDKRKCNNKKGLYYDNIFQGLVRCPKCGYALTPKTDYRLKKKELIDFVHFSCSTYKKYGVNACSSHRIEARDLYNIVLEDIQYHGNMALSAKEDFVEKIIEKIEVEKIDEGKELSNKLELKKNQLAELDRSYEQLYEDRLEGNITERNFNLMNVSISKKQDKLIDEIKVLEGDIEVSFETEDNYKKFMDNISKYAKIKSLNRYILNQIIDKIYVYDKEEIDGQISQKVEIHYKFIGKLN
ncbi:MAG: recombinase family protein [Streptococcus anginosus]|uniref:recombinase family protein n=1 Tax=Peptostreptococcus sp. MV1 TaxID=1219626 RepID=UPI00050FF17C|nr:recombinase family protein [Peptostreptococcus sp. MV1]MDU1591953.1 recombinase family protein [Streptococcus anginosus]MDU1664538.1 recombinase family protein [Peptoniphilus harei]MDU4764968.1 recombinase family protein [Streptococcus agalactiae]KGF12628.1 recombinase [Peptostreptococcus sp. MV1]HEN2588910.1 recombinase family protein [Streptococcus agalactiae]